MATNDALKKDVLRLAALGITQKAMAGRMGVSEATLTRWLKGDARAVTVDAMDGLALYAQELITALQHTLQTAARTTDQKLDGLVADTASRGPDQQQFAGALKVARVDVSGERRRGPRVRGKQGK